MSHDRQTFKTEMSLRTMRRMVLQKLTAKNIDLLNFRPELLPEERQYIKGQLVNEVSKIFAFDMSELA
ncbi:12282_t:CDS:1, partial [Dentiscutata heterogama]